MPVTLESRIRQMQIFNLPHDVCCKAACTCSDVTILVTEENPRTGDRAQRHVSKKASPSLTLLALERRAALPTTLLGAPDVRAAIAKGHVRVVEQQPDALPSTAPSPTPETLHEAVSAALPKEG